MIFTAFSEKPMNILEESIGKTVCTQVACFGQWQVITGELGGINKFRFIEIKQNSKISFIDLKNWPAKLIEGNFLKVPFIWFNVGIQKIEILKEGSGSELIFENWFIPNNYDISDPSRVCEIIEIIFGKDVVLEKYPRLLSYVQKNI